MTPDQWATWLGPAAVGALAIILWWRLNKQDAVAEAARVEAAEIKSLLTAEMRLFDVRLSIVERQLAVLSK